jgi:signal transduction histidine kinase
MTNRQPDLGNIRILCMDDEQGILDLLTFELTSHGYQVVTAHDGEEGIEKFKEGKFNIVISDIKMPKLSGLDVLPVLKNIDPNVEVIMTTGFGTIDMAVESIKNGAYDFISKPYNLDELYSRIEKALEKQKLSSEIVSLKELHRLKSEFLANTSHELRTPMNAIIGYTSLLLDGIYGNLTEKQQSVLKRVGTNANNLLHLINNILDISKLTAGKITLYVEEFKLHEAITEVTDAMESLAREKNIFLKVNDFPNNIVMTGDRTRLKQVMINLLGNAIKFTNTGGITVNVDCKQLIEPTEKDKSPNISQICISVVDTGIGIKPEFIETIFEEFRQGDASTTREYGGTGLGLTIVKKLAELMGGFVSVTSEVGKGSIFSITLPCRCNDVITMEQVMPGDLQNGSIDAHKKIILSIDDDPEVHHILKDTLAQTEYTLVCALNSDEGISMAKQLHPFAITLDILMPHRDGWSTLQALKNDEDTMHIPVIILSVMENKALGFSLGSADYISKPFERKTLIERLGKLSNASTRKVMILDDDKEFNNILRTLLQNAGYRITSIDNGNTALELIKAERPDFVILDLMMPKMSGFEFLQKLQAIPGNEEIRVIIMTAKTLTDQEATELGKRAEVIITKGSKNLRDILNEIKRQFEKNHGNTAG